MTSNEDDNLVRELDLTATGFYLDDEGYVQYGFQDGDHYYEVRVPKAWDLNETLAAEGDKPIDL